MKFIFLGEGLKVILSAGLSVNEILIQLMTVLGGLGIFLYGINLMGDSLKAIAGDRLKGFIEKTTNTPLKGILIGALVTALIQSSSGTTALTVGLVRAGLMSFPQAVGVIMGANIGTTITSFIIGLKIEKYALIFVGIGAILIFFVKSEKIKEIGRIILGFGMLFFGLSLMGDALNIMLTAYEEQTTAIFEWFADYPIFGLFIGAGITAVVQSSSATIGILQTLYSQGTIVLLGAIPILLGCNIGTTVTACFACIGGGIQAKRTAMVHAMFNVIGALLFMVLLWPFNQAMIWIETTLLAGLGPHPAMSLAVAHMIFNLVTTFVLYFFINLMVKFATKVVKEKENPENALLEELLDYSLIEKSPTLALTFVKKSINYMTQCVKEYVYLAKEYSFVEEKGVIDKGEELEKTINCLDKRIHDYLIRLTITHLNETNSHLLSVYLDQIKDLERVGDHCSNILEFFEERYETDKHLSEDSLQDLDQIYGILLQMVDAASDAILNWDLNKAEETATYEDQIDKLEEVFHQRHVHRINSGACSYLNSDHYVEILSNIERMGDHLKNISDGILTKEYCQYDEYNH